MDIDNFSNHIKSKYVYEDIAYDFEKRFATSNDEFDRPLLIGKNIKSNLSLKLMKGELGVKIITKFVELRPKIDDGNSDKKQKEQKKCVVKWILKFHYYKKRLVKNETILKS